jgi:hypothetical protein
MRSREQALLQQALPIPSATSHTGRLNYPFRHAKSPRPELTCSRTTVFIGSYHSSRRSRSLERVPIRLSVQNQLNPRRNIVASAAWQLCRAVDVEEDWLACPTGSHAADRLCQCHQRRTTPMRTRGRAGAAPVPPAQRRSLPALGQGRQGGNFSALSAAISPILLAGCGNIV